MRGSDLLKKALALFGPNGERWGQRDYALDVRGERADNMSEAVCFCGLGSLRVAVCGDFLLPTEFPLSPHAAAYFEARLALKEFAELRGHPSWPHWQDAPHRQFSQVRAAFNEAIARLERKEARAA